MHVKLKDQKLRTGRVWQYVHVHADLPYIVQLQVSGGCVLWFVICRFRCPLCYESAVWAACDRLTSDVTDPCTLSGLTTAPSPSVGVCLLNFALRVAVGERPDQLDIDVVTDVRTWS